MNLEWKMYLLLWGKFLWPFGVLKIYLTDSVIILSVHISGIANNVASFSGVEIILNSKKSSNIYFVTNVSTFWNAVLVLGNLFWARFR